MTVDQNLVLIIMFASGDVALGFLAWFLKSLDSLVTSVSDWFFVADSFLCLWVKSKGPYSLLGCVDGCIIYLNPGYSDAH